MSSIKIWFDSIWPSRLHFTVKPSEASQASLGLTVILGTGPPEGTSENAGYPVANTRLVDSKKWGTNGPDLSKNLLVKRWVRWAWIDFFGLQMTWIIYEPYHYDTLILINTSVTVCALCSNLSFSSWRTRVAQSSIYWFFFNGEIICRNQINDNFRVFKMPCR